MKNIFLTYIKNNEPRYLKELYPDLSEKEINKISTLLFDFIQFENNDALTKKLQDEFPQLGKRYWGKHFWAIGYAAFSSGHVTDDMIKEYIAEHENHPNHNDDVFKVE